jgi:putative flippase GtrA
MRLLIGRGIRFTTVGVLCTVIGYVVFVSLTKVVHYEIANVGAWASGVGVGFLLNRYVTYKIRGPDGLPMQFGLFVLGSLGQLVVSSLGYAILISGFHLGPTPAYVLNLVFTASYMFAYLESVAFGAAVSDGRKALAQVPEASSPPSA